MMIKVENESPLYFSDKIIKLIRHLENLELQHENRDAKYISMCGLLEDLIDSESKAIEESINNPNSLREIEKMLIEFFPYLNQNNFIAINYYNNENLLKYRFLEIFLTSLINNQVNLYGKFRSDVIDIINFFGNQQASEDVRAELAIESSIQSNDIALKYSLAIVNPTFCKEMAKKCFKLEQIPHYYTKEYVEFKKQRLEDDLIEVIFQLMPENGNYIDQNLQNVLYGILLFIAQQIYKVFDNNSEKAEESIARAFNMLKKTYKSSEKEILQSLFNIYEKLEELIETSKKSY